MKIIITEDQYGQLTNIIKRVISESNTKDPKCKKGDCKNGYGEYYENNNDYYKGYYKNGEKDGYGEQKRSNGGPNDQSEYRNVNGYLYKGKFKNNDKNGYGTLKLDTGGVFKGNFRSGAGEGYGVFTNRYGRVFKGNWISAANFTILKVASGPENKQYGNMNLYDLENVKKSSNLDTKKCVQPPSDIGWIKSKTDKNYEYVNGGQEFGFCWWTRNITNGKVFNLSELAKTNPKIQQSINSLNKEYLGKYTYI